MMDRRRVLRRLVAGGLLAPALAGAFTACSDKSDAKFHAVDISGASYGQGFKLVDDKGETRTLKDWRGDVVAVFFGYTHCPDVCPTTLAELAQVRRKLGTEADKFQVLFISLDPERDTPQVLESYTAAFDPSFVGLTTRSVTEVPALAKSYKIFYQKVDKDDGSPYTLDHSTGVFLYDPKGRLRLFARDENTTDQLASDIRQLIQGA